MTIGRTGPELRDAARAAGSRDWKAFSVHLRAVFATVADDAIERASLLRLLGLAHFVNGHPDDGRDCFVKAAAIEQDADHALGRNHTSHELALMLDARGDLGKIQSYYKETLRNLKAMGNAEGMALCLRSLGELALVGGLFDQGVSCLETSGRLLEKSRTAEASAVRRFLALLEDGTATV